MDKVGIGELKLGGEDKGKGVASFGKKRPMNLLETICSIAEIDH